MTIEVGTVVRWTETGTVTHAEFEVGEDGADTLRWVVIEERDGKKWTALPDEISEAEYRE